MRHSAALEEAGAPVVGDAAVVPELLPAPGMEGVVDDLVAEGGAQRLGAVDQGTRVGARLGDRADALGVVGVAVEGGLELEPVLDAVQTGGDGGGKGEVGIGIRTRDAALHAQAGAAADDAEPGGAVVLCPDRL